MVGHVRFNGTETKPLRPLEIMCKSHVFNSLELISISSEIICEHTLHSTRTIFIFRIACNITLLVHICLLYIYQLVSSIRIMADVYYI